MGRRAVFIDRDGTLTAEAGLIQRVDQVSLLPGSVEAIQRINAARWQAVIVTNQPWVGQGALTEDELADVHEAVRHQLLESDARLDGIYHCPHHPEATVERFRETCRCRKPGIGMFERAESEMGIELDASVMVGDRLTDLQAAREAGMRSVLVRTGQGQETEAALEQHPNLVDHVADNLLDALDWVLADVKAPA